MIFRKRTEEEDDLASLIVLPLIVPVVFLLFDLLPFSWLVKIILALFLIFIGGTLISYLVNGVRKILGPANRKVNGSLISVLFITSLLLCILFL